MKFIEQFLIALETPFRATLYRVLVGFSIMAVFARIKGQSQSWTLLVATLLGVLVALRIAPAVIRKVIPFSPDSQRIWSERRHLAKRYDSYQWRKLLGFGFGLVLGILVFQQFTISTMVVSSFCVIAGLAGTLRWRSIARQISTPHSAGGYELRAGHDLNTGRPTSPIV